MCCSVHSNEYQHHMFYRNNIGHVKQQQKFRWSCNYFRNHHIKRIFFLPIILNIFFVCSKSPSHFNHSFKYPQHTFWLRNNNFKWRTLFWSPRKKWVLHLAWTIFQDLHYLIRLYIFEGVEWKSNITSSDCRYSRELSGRATLPHQTVDIRGSWAEEHHYLKRLSIFEGVERKSNITSSDCTYSRELSGRATLPHQTVDIPGSWVEEQHYLIRL